MSFNDPLPNCLGKPLLYACTIGFAGLLVVLGWLHRNIVLVLAAIGLMLCAFAPLREASADTVTTNWQTGTYQWPIVTISETVTVTNDVHHYHTNTVTVTNCPPTTTTTIPPSDPYSLTVSVSGNTATLKWTDTYNGEVGWLVYRQSGTNWVNWFSVGSNRNSADLFNLSTGSYTVRVAPQNANFQPDAFSRPVTFTIGGSGTTTVPVTTTTTTIPPTTNTPPIAIPVSHPRLLTTNDAARARAWYAANPFTPSSGSFDHEGQRLDFALHYICTGNTNSARTSIARSLATIIPPGQVDTNNSGASSDVARWMGEVINVTYDLCHDQWTPSERQTIIDRWNQYYYNLTKLPWGNLGFEANNYFWGYLRNELEWGIATYHENSMARYFIDYALKRYASFKTYAATKGRGGVVAEGTSYGPVNTWYHLLPFLSVKSMGRDLISETPFWREAVYAIIHGTTPSPVTREGDGTPRYEWSLFNDCPYPDTAGAFTSRPYSGDMMAVMASLYPNDPVGRHAKTWLDMTKPMLSKWVQATVSYKGIIAQPFNDLPLYYFAPGTKHVWMRTSWAPDATLVFFQAGKYERVGHWHQDAGSVQVVKGNKYITRITAGSYKDLNGYNGRVIQNPSPEAHNLAIIGGFGPQKNSVEKGDTMAGVMDTAGTCTATADLTNVYLSDGRVPSPPITSYVRKVTLDRSNGMVTVTDTVNATTETKLTQCWHSETTPPPFMLSPPAPTRVVDETRPSSGIMAQYRHEIEMDAPVGVTTLTTRIEPK